MGKAKNLRVRVASYTINKKRLGLKTALLVSHIASIDHTIVQSELEALLLEANFIKQYAPPFNVTWKDGKAYPFIKITIKDSYPAVLQTRKIDDTKGIFFGPFPNIGDVRRILKYVRRIFPYQSVRNHPKRYCLYYHLGLCPCPPMFTTREQKKAYRRNIRHLIAFLSGEKEHVMRTLQKEMVAAAKREDFEEAARIKRQLDTIVSITSPTYTPAAYIENPNLVADEAKLDIESLHAVLTNYFRGLTPKSLARIECYDISNIQGKEATGSMAVTTDGIIDKSQYRRFRIRFKNTPDDIAMHKEILFRRLKHLEWQLPDLIVIDGGVAQVNAGMNVVEKHGLTIPVIGLAKRLEEIILPAFQGETLDRQRRAGENRTIRLSRNHRALRLLQRLRDEAHRFAITYHRKLRRKRLIS